MSITADKTINTNIHNTTGKRLRILNPTKMGLVKIGKIIQEEIDVELR